MTCWNGFDMRLSDRFVKMTEYSWYSPRSSFGTGRYSSLEAASAGGGGGGGSIVDNEERKRPEEGGCSAPGEGEEAAPRSNAQTGGAARAADAAAPVFRAMLLIANCVAARIPEDMGFAFAPASLRLEDIYEVILGVNNGQGRGFPQKGCTISSF